MVVRLRLQRFGCKNAPFYRVVAADARSPRDGKFLEIVSKSCEYCALAYAHDHVSDPNLCCACT
jgi:predicted Zn-ribbon and HTH transcriptional regulator